MSGSDGTPLGSLESLNGRPIARRDVVQLSPDATNTLAAKRVVGSGLVDGAGPVDGLGATVGARLAPGAHAGMGGR